MGELILKGHSIPSGEYTGYNVSGWDGVKCSPILSGSKFTSIKVNGGIGNYALAHLSTLQSVEIGQNGGFNERAFYDCTASALILNCPIREGTYDSSILKGTTFKYITVNTEIIPKYSFSGLSPTSLELGENVRVIEEGAFFQCHTTSIVIPSNVTTIGSSAFENCSELTSINIPENVTNIGERAFFNCISMEKVLSLCSIPPSCPENVFGGLYGKNTYDNAVLYVPRSAINSYKTTLPWSYFGDVQPITAKYNLTYILDGKVYKTYEIEFNASITQELAPTKEGYTFSGWSEIPETMPNHDVIVTGSFTVNSYALTYIVDGVKYKKDSLEYNATITPEPVPTKEGYTFSVWSEIPATMPAHDVEVTGTFTVNSYMMVYVLDGEIYTTLSVQYGAAITPETVPAKEGYTFSGWSNVPETMPAHDVTIQGQYNINSHTLTYKVDGQVYKTYTLEYHTAITPEAEPTKEGYTFSGWGEIPELMPDNDVVVTGTFNINSYTLTYMVDGEVYKTSTVVYGTALTPEAEPTKEGYTFSGWSGIQTTMPAHDVVVTGTFSINSYTLTYKIDGEVYKTSTIAYGTALTPEAEPTKEGYTFSGWDDVPETMPAHDVVVTGSFSINSYFLFYVLDGGIYKAYSIKYGTVIVPETEPDKEGYLFSGWSEIPATMPDHDVVVNGNFYLYGDVNGDDKVDLSDAIMVTYYSLHQIPAKFNEAVADMNDDGEIDLSDAIIIIYKSLGVIL